jgi:hypothetical protein
MLLYAEGNFFQVLEGPKDVVEALYDKIERDPRHNRVTQIISEPIARRSFGAWHMACYATTRRELSMLTEAGAHAAPLSELNMAPGRARKLVAAFCDGRWRQKLGNGQVPQEA